MGYRSRTLWIVAAVGLLAGCDEQLNTENDQLRLTAPLLSYSAWRTEHAIAEQSRLCPDFKGYRVSDDDERPVYAEAEEQDELRACYDMNVQGASLSDDGECISYDTPGTATWEFVRTACAIEGDFGDDRLVFEVLPITGLRGALSYSEPIPSTVEGLILHGYDELPDDFSAEVGVPVDVVEDVFDRIEALVVRDGSNELVAVTDASLSITDSEPADSGRIEYDVPDHAHLHHGVTGARAGDVIDVGIVLPSGPVDAGRINVVSREEIASLSLHALVTQEATTGALVEASATSIARASDGRILRQAPVQWSIDNERYRLVPDGYDDDDPNADPRSPHVAIRDACDGARDGETRSAVLEGTIDDLRETVEVEWECAVPEQTGCACHSDAPPSHRGWWLVTLLGLVVRRRRSHG